MKEFNLGPAAWRRLSRRDKKILHYFRLVAEFHLDLYQQRLRQDAERQKLMAGMPKLRR